MSSALDETQPDLEHEQRDEVDDSLDFDFNDEYEESSHASELSSLVVIERIESFTAHWLEQIHSKTNPILSMPSRETANGSQRTATTTAVQTRSLVSNQGAQALGIARLFLILEVSHELLVSPLSLSLVDTC